MRYAILLYFIIFNVYYLCAQTAINNIYGNGGAGTGYTIISDKNGYFIQGNDYSSLYDGWYAIVLLKIDSSGNILWQKDYGKKSFGYQGGNSGGCQETSSEDYIIPGGYRDSATGIWTGLLILVNKNGDTIWTKTFGGSNYNLFNECIETVNKNFVAIGQTYNFGNTNGAIYLVKLDSTGTILWQKAYGSNSGSAGYRISLLNDGGFILSGITDCIGPGTTNNYLIKTDSLGNIEWTKTYGSAGSNGACLAYPDKEGGYIMFGNWDTIDLNNGVSYVAKLDSVGNIKWVKLFNDPVSIDQIRELKNGDLLAVGSKTKPAGYLFYDGYIAKLDSNGHELWEKILEYQGPGISSTNTNSIIGAFYDFQSTQDSGFVLTGSSNFIDTANNQIQEIWLVKTDSLGCIDSYCGIDIEGIKKFSIPNEDLKIYPNPAYSSVTMEWQPTAANEATVVIYDMLGRVISSQQISSGKAEVNVSGMENGLYVVRLLSPSGVALGNCKLSILK